MSKKRITPFLMITSALVTSIFLIFTLSSINSKNVFKTLQTEQLKIFSKNGKGEIDIGFENLIPKITIKKENGELLWEIQGGEEPNFTMYQNERPVAMLTSAKEGGVDFILSDEKMIPKIHLTSSKIPGFFLKNDQDKTVGSWTVINDGGGGFGLADGSGRASALIRGGESPSLAFFMGKNEPLAALGIMQQTPHLLISGPDGNEGILIHGGRPNSMLVVDEEGKVKILISKHGVFQGKEKNDMQLRKKDQKVFSLEDHDRLFPSISKGAR